MKKKQRWLKVEKINTNFEQQNLKNINSNNDYVGQIRRSYFSYWTYS